METILEFFKLILSNDPFFELAIFLLLVVFFSLAIILLGLRIFLKFLDKDEFIHKQIAAETARLNSQTTEGKIEEKPNQLVKLYVKLNTLLKTDLKKVCIEVDAERIAIYLFHNGTYSLSGFPFIKMSCICEILKPHSNTMLKQQQQVNIPINAVDDFLTDLFHNNIFISTKSEKDLGIVDKLLLNQNESFNSYIAIAILDKSELEEPPIGFLMAEFKNIDDNTRQEKIDSLVKLAEESSYALQVSSFMKQQDSIRKETNGFYG